MIPRVKGGRPAEVRLASRKTLRWLSPILGGLAATLAIAGVSELALRLYLWRGLTAPVSMWVADPELVYRLNPDNPDSPQSFRGKAPDAGPGHGIRLICVGGSTTYGHAVEAGEAWPAVLESHLREMGLQDVEVINAGVPGYGTRQVLLHYRRDIAKLQPNYVIVHMGWNGAGALVDPRGFVPISVPLPGSSPSARLFRSFMSHSLLLQKVFARMVRYLLTRRKVTKPDQFQDVFVSDLRTLTLEIESQHQTPVLVVYPAVLHRDMSPAEAALYESAFPGEGLLSPDSLADVESKHETIRGQARELHVPCVDLENAFTAFRGKSRVALFIDRLHLSVAGNRKFGEIMADRILPLIDSGSARQSEDQTASATVTRAQAVRCR